MRAIFSFLVIVVAAAVVLYTTPHGLGVSPDSASYLKGASGMLSGQGLSYLSTQWPPLYPAAVAAFGAVFHADVMLGARVLNALLYGLNYLLLVTLLKRFIPSAEWLAVVMAALICLQPPLALIHYYAWTEPLFMALMLGDILLLLSMQQRSSQAWYRALLILFATLALLTRYTGLAMPMLNAAAIFAFSTEAKMWVRLRRAVVQLLIPMMIFAPWTLHRGVGDSAATARKIVFRALPLDTLQHALSTIGHWLLPAGAGNGTHWLKTLAPWLGALLLCLPLGCLLFAVLLNKLSAQPSLRQGRAGFASELCSPDQIPLMVGSSYVLIYLSLLYGAISFFDNKVPFDNRILAPVFPVLMVLLIASVRRLAQPVLKSLGLAIIALMLSTSYSSFRGWLLFSKFNGIEISSVSVRTSPIHNFMQTCSREARVFADQPWNFELEFNKKVLWLPNRTLYYLGQTNPEYHQQMARLGQVADLIVIENPNSDAINDVDQLDSFVRINETGAVLVWINTNATTVHCLSDVLGK